jgi:hypothetical protein
MISLRISDVEYDALKKIYRNYGARNVSDFARLSMQRIMSGGHGVDLELALKVHEIEERVKSLETNVGLLLNRVRGVS